jgi:hypothetical protein
MKDKGRIVWKERFRTKLMNYGTPITFLMFLIVISFYDTEEQILYIFIILFFLFITLLNFTLRFSYMTLNGIRLGNYNIKYKYYFFPKKIKYFHWKDIKKIKIIGKSTYGYKIASPKDYLIIKSKIDNKSYDCYISDSRGFVKALKKLKKDYLLDRYSKYLKV